MYFEEYIYVNILYYLCIVELYLFKVSGVIYATSHPD